MRRNRPDKDGTHRGAFEKNKKKIYATQTVCGICGKPVDFSLKYPHPLSPYMDTSIFEKLESEKGDYRWSIRTAVNGK